MIELAWMKVFIGTEAAVTGHLTPEEFGCYERLRRHYWQNCAIPDDDARLMRITGTDVERWPVVAATVLPLMSAAIARIENERTDAAEKRAVAVERSRKANEAKKARASMATPTRSPSSTPTRSPNGVLQGNLQGHLKDTLSASDEVRYEEGLAPPRTHDAPAPARPPIPRTSDRLVAGRWLTEHADLFPGDPGFMVKVDMMINGTLTWDHLRSDAA